MPVVDEPLHATDHELAGLLSGSSLAVEVIDDEGSVPVLRESIQRGGVALPGQGLEGDEF